MNIPRLFIRRGRKRFACDSLAPFLTASLETTHRMDREQMGVDDQKHCRWIGYGISKGVTHPDERLTVFGVPEKLASGLHGKLIQGFEHIPVDSTPLCYEPTSPRGFNGFIRWVFLTDPHRVHDVLGIDYSLMLSPKSGVAIDMPTVAKIVDVLVRQGIAPGVEVALLNAKMCEPEALRAWRRFKKLVTVRDWSERGQTLFHPPGPFCPRCGMATLLKPTDTYCSHCGCKPSLIWARHEYEPNT